MNVRLTRLLARLYPSEWRMRYGEEFRWFLGERPLTVRAMFNVIVWALYERVCSFGGLKMSKFQHSVVLTMYAYLAAILAGVNLYGTVDDTPLAVAMQSQGGLSACWTLVELGSILALLGVVAMGLPVLIAMIRFTLALRRRDILVRLAFAPCAVAVTIIWVVAVGVLRTGHKPPIPWAVSGDALGWPPSGIDWTLGFVTFILVIATLVGTAISIKQSIHRTEFSEQRFTFGGRSAAVQPFQFVKLAAFFVAGAIVLMAAGVAGWGLLANQYSPAAFQSRFGPLETTTPVSWLSSLTLFVASAVMAIRSVRWAVASPVE